MLTEAVRWDPIGRFWRFSISFQKAGPAPPEDDEARNCLKCAESQPSITLTSTGNCCATYARQLDLSALRRHGKPRKDTTCAVSPDLKPTYRSAFRCLEIIRQPHSIRCRMPLYSYAMFNACIKPLVYPIA